VEWVTAQLTSWAQKTMSSADLTRVVVQKLRMSLRTYYPVIEDDYGKQDTAYAEYLFIEYQPGQDYGQLEKTEEFRRVLRNKHGKPELLPDHEIQRVKVQVGIQTELHPGDVVKISRTALRGNRGRVIHAANGQAQLEVRVGGETIQTALPIDWLRRVKKGPETQYREMEVGRVATEENTPAPPPPPPVLPPPPPATTVVRVMRKGPKNSRVLLSDGATELRPNEELVSP